MNKITPKVKQIYNLLCLEEYDLTSAKEIKRYKEDVEKLKKDYKVTEEECSMMSDLIDFNYNKKMLNSEIDNLTKKIVYNDDDKEMDNKEFQLLFLHAVRHIRNILHFIEKNYD